MNVPAEPAADHSSARPAPTPADRRRIDEIFGDVLPDVTGDERDRPRAADRDRDDDRWYLDNRPPHHG
ncbi:hypothetical protein [Nakamurella sp.]|uniref:hypothetical protein n=1 Tax=Nakamurella sp. TaxID=1869182 RepID=UPI003B3A594A